MSNLWTPPPGAPSPLDSLRVPARRPTLADIHARLAAMPPPVAFPTRAA